MNDFLLYVYTRSTSIGRYAVEQLVFLLVQWVPTILGIGLRFMTYKALLKSRGCFVIEENVTLTHPARIILGRGVYIGKNCFLGASDAGLIIEDGAVILDGCYLNVFNYLKKRGKSIHLKKRSVLATQCVIHGHQGFILGENSIVGPQSTFITGDHGSIKDGANYRDGESSPYPPIAIGNNVWIGAKVTVLPGIRIGDNAVIGAGSVVTKDVLPGAIMVGVPAKRLEKEK